ncbi:MAG TPA: glycosyltransferase [Azospirillaceae bacterium]|nr:glycosyltransferase [Azospirillaceae bacterium]
MTAIDVCVATYRRPDLLAALLRTLAGQRFDDGASPRLIVVDNDADGSARAVVEAFAATASFPVTYAIEPRKSIAHARNKALELAGGGWVAFLDDDEEAIPEWLANLVDAARRFQADVVFGPVLSVLPDDAPVWVRKGRFFDRRRFPCGTVRPTGGFGNVLIDRRLLDRVGRGVDPDYGVTGGEDTEFFTFLGRSGAKMIWCDTAVASEAVPPPRLTLGWLLRRHYRAGQVFARVALPYMGVTGKLALALKRLGFAILAGVAAPGLWLIRRHWGVASLLAAVRNLGQLSALVGGRFKEYV